MANNQKQPYLSSKEREFIRNWVSGMSEREAAKKTGYSENYGHVLANKTKIKREYGRLQSMRDHKAISDAEDIQQTLTEIKNDPGQATKDRIAAMKELNRMQGNNAPVKTEHEQKGTVTFLFQKADGSQPKIDGELEAKSVPEEHREESGVQRLIEDMPIREDVEEADYEGVPEDRDDGQDVENVGDKDEQPVEWNVEDPVDVSELKEAKL